MSLRDKIADGLVALYGMNRRTLQLRGGYRMLQTASKILPKLRAYPIQFPGTAEVHFDVKDADTFWMLNSFLGDTHCAQRHMVKIAETSLMPGDVVWDVGGNMGFFSMHVAQSRFRLKAVHLFEPHPAPIKVARELLGANPIVHFHHFALGDVKGTANLYYDEGTVVSSLKYRPKKNFHQIPCTIETGDSVVEEGRAEPPNFMKIDVEGYEQEVLKGLEKTIASSKPAIYFEIIFLTREEILKVVPKDYRFYFVQGTDGRLTSDFDSAHRHLTLDGIMAHRDDKLWSKLESRIIGG